MADRFYFRPIKSETRAFEVVDGATVIGTIRNVNMGDCRRWKTCDWQGNPLPLGLGKTCKTKLAAAQALADAEAHRVAKLGGG